MKVFFNIQMTMMRFLKHTPLLLWLAIALGGCNVGPNASPSDKLAVVATHSILGDLVQQIGGTAIDLTVLVGPDGDTHTFEPSPADGVHLTKASLIFENGMGYEPWLTDLYSATNSQAQQVVISAAITPRMIANSEQGDVDPHIWHSVPNAQLMVQAIQAELVSADPAHATVYNANADAYQAQLAELDGWIRTQVATIPPANRKLVTSHDTFGYFAETYGFEVLGTAIGSLSTESGDANAAQIAALVTEIRKTGVPAIFAENIHNPQLMEQIAREAGVTLAPALYTDALGAPASAGDSYLKLMRYNVATIVQALQAPK